MQIGGGGINLEDARPRRVMTENKIVDPFKPAQPRIPGVSWPGENAKAPEVRADEMNPAPRVAAPAPDADHDSLGQGKFVWAGLTLATALITAFLLFGLNRKTTTPVTVQAEVAGPPTPAPSSQPKPVNTNLPVGPGPIATPAQLAKSWSSKEFYFRNSLTQEPELALVVRLPGGALWGFLLHEPYGTCELQYVTDLRKLRLDYDFTANHPMVADPCSKTVYDLARYGNGPGGLVRGEIAKGSGWRPPLAIEIRSQNNQIVAVQMEQ